MQKSTKLILGAISIPFLVVGLKIASYIKRAGNLEWSELVIFNNASSKMVRLTNEGKTYVSHAPNGVFTKSGAQIEYTWDGPFRKIYQVNFGTGGLPIWKGRIDGIWGISSNHDSMAIRSIDYSLVINVLTGKAIKYNHAWVVIGDDNTMAIARADSSRKFWIHLLRDGVEYGKVPVDIRSLFKMSGIDYDGINITYSTFQGGVYFYTPTRSWHSPNPNPFGYDFINAKLAGPTTCYVISKSISKILGPGGNKLLLMDGTSQREHPIPFVGSIYTGKEAKLILYP